jgi:hypothetical protein
MLDHWGQRDPRNMPRHLFPGALHIAYATAVRADVSKQNCSVCPRYWYIDATFRCARCDDTFVFAAQEQHFWYEELGFWLDSQAKHCGKCRHDLRELKALRQEYDQEVTAVLSQNADLDRKQRLLEVLDSLDRSGVKLPKGICENRRILMAQVDRLRHSDTA